jgi:hypothetical protein
VLALGSASAHERAGCSNKRLPLHNSSREVCVAQGRQHKLRGARVERARAGGSGGRRNLVL